MGCAFLALAAAPTARSAQAGETLVLTGSSTIAPLVAEMGKHFEANHPGTRIDVQTGGTSRGIRDARQGLAHIGLVSRSLSDTERDLTAFPIALDGIAMIVHKSNPVRELSRQQIIGIYTGKITDWSELGGPGGTIVVENKAEGRSTLELFLNYFKLPASDIRAAVIVGDNQEAIKIVAGNPRAIGYVSIGSAVYEAEIGTPIRPLPMDGVAPTIDAVKDLKFPITRELNLVVKNQPSGTVKEFISFAQSDDVREIVKEYFFVPYRK
ncbi:MAG: phosphate ABC transporter substrate-binding protein [Rhodospirillaceae bacterium]|nr:phosphate ABC transporter substrate-binding protein [Rhodospirillales bacterium]